MGVGALTKFEIELRIKIGIGIGIGIMVTAPAAWRRLMGGWVLRVLVEQSVVMSYAICEPKLRWWFVMIR